MSAAPPGPLYKRLLWMLALWSAGVIALGIVSLLLRFAITR